MVSFVQVLGWIILLILGFKALCHFCHFIYLVCLMPVFGRNLDPRRYGPWAVITGATDGLGQAFAYKLASLGMNIVLISRSRSKLLELAYEIKQEHHSVKIRTIEVDFTECQKIYPILRFELADLSVGLLVNNVGMDVPLGPFAQLESDEEIERIINCNIMSMARLTNILLPGMRRKQRGIIINLGSILGVGSTPTATLYGATKAFVDKFSRDVAAECRRDGVIIQSVMPTMVATKLSGFHGTPSVCVPTPEKFVEANLSTLGIESRTAAYWVHRILLYWQEILYYVLPNTIRWLTVKLLHFSYKNRELRLKEQENVSD